MESGATATVAMLFCDVVGSTQRQTRVGDEASDGFRRRLFTVLRRCISESGGVEVKNLGDGLMVVFERSVIDAVACAIAMHAAVTNLDADHPVQIRVGISAGEVSADDGDWFGTPVIEAARLCGAADPDQTLASAVVAALVGSRGRRYRFGSLGVMELKGLGAPLPVVEVVEVAGDVEAADIEAAGRPPDGGGVPPVETGPATQSRRSRRRFGLAAMAVVVVAAGLIAWVITSGGQHLGTPRVAARHVVQPRPLGYEPRVESVPCLPAVLASIPEAECSELVVPAVRDDPRGPAVRLSVTKAAARGTSSARPVVLLDSNELLAVTSLRDVADVYTLSLRGFTAGQPTPTCPDLAEVWRDGLSRRFGESEAVSARVTAAGACAARLKGKGVRLDAFNLAEVADDISDLVTAAGLGKVSVAAGNLATAATIRFADAHPQMVESLLFTNPARPGQSVLSDPTASLAKRFDRLADLCAVDAACAASVGDLRQKYAERVDMLNAGPHLVETSPLSGGAPVVVLLDGLRLAAALETAMTVGGRLGQVPSAILGSGDQLAAASAINEEVNLFIADGSPAAVALSYGCSYDIRLNRIAELSDSATPRFAGADEPTFRKICEVWSVPSVYDELSQPLTADVPVFIAEAGFSVSGAIGSADAMVVTARKPIIARFPTMSDDLIFVAPPCLRDLRRNFLTDPSTPGDVAACEAMSPPIEFVTGG